MQLKLLITLVSAAIVISFTPVIPSSYGLANNSARIDKHLPPGSTKKHREKRGPRPRLQKLSKNPYLGAIAIDASSQDVLFEDNADVRSYPASLVKMMNFLIILEAVKSARITLQDRVVISAEAARIGGSQVYLQEKEVQTVEDLLYALMVTSANDAATALALHYTGSKELFVRLMNKRGQELGMKDTVFHSVHGLPPGRGQLPDISTPRDMIKLCLELLKHDETFKYTATKVRLFREDTPKPFIMRNHNRLVGSFEGCDGLKTGYFRAAGFSIAATASQQGVRTIAVIIGAETKKVRDSKARKLLSTSLREAASKSQMLSVSTGSEMNSESPRTVTPSAVTPYFIPY